MNVLIVVDDADVVLMTVVATEGASGSSSWRQRRWLPHQGGRYDVGRPWYSAKCFVHNASSPLLSADSSPHPGRRQTMGRLGHGQIGVDADRRYRAQGANRPAQ